MLKIPHYLRKDIYCEELKRKIFLGYRNVPDGYIDIFVFDSETEEMLFPVSQSIKVDNNKYVPTGGTFCNPPEEYNWIFHFLEFHRIATEQYGSMTVDNREFKLYRFEYSRMIDISLYTITDHGLEKAFYHPLCYVIGVTFKSNPDKVYNYLSKIGIPRFAKILVQTKDGPKEVEVESSKRYRPHEQLPMEYEKMKWIDVELNKTRLDAYKDEPDPYVDYIPYDPRDNED